MLKITSCKIAKKKEKFKYKNKTYDTNPFAVCNKNISKKKNPDKWERCVMDVKSKSESN